METLTHIWTSERQVKYNDVLRKGLNKLSIEFYQQSTKYGYYILVKKSDLFRAQDFVLSISLVDPKHI